MGTKETEVEFLQRQVNALESLLKVKNEEIESLRNRLDELYSGVSRIRLYAMRHEKDLVPFFAARKVLKLFKEL